MATPGELLHMMESLERQFAEAKGENERLQTQVAVMRKLLERSAVLVPYTSDLQREIDQALAAAPRVITRLEGKAAKRMDGSLLVMARHDDAIQIYHASDDRHYEGGYSTLGEPIEDVEVYVVECPRRPEQGQDSEQGYKRARGAIPWKEGDESPEDTIARIRGRGQESEE